MRWNLRGAAAARGITTAAELRRRLADHGLVVSLGKMSALWSGEPLTVRLGDLDVICAVLACTPNDLLLLEPQDIAWRAGSARPHATHRSLHVRSPGG